MSRPSLCEWDNPPDSCEITDGLAPSEAGRTTGSVCFRGFETDDAANGARLWARALRQSALSCLRIRRLGLREVVFERVDHQLHTILHV